MKRLMGCMNNKGFSLGEVAAAVGVAALLAAIAIPTYNKYTYQARQSEAKGNLAALYGAMIAFEAEHDTYTTRFDVNGFAVTGNLVYRTGFVVDKGPPPTSDEWSVSLGTCIITSIGAAKPACRPGYPQAYQITGGTDGAASIPFFPAAPVTDTNFTAYALGKSNGVDVDSWSVNEVGEIKRL
ncbi:MAG: hypothetical protein ABL958_15280 [Bdellovibrionia bacterium]